MLSFFIKNERMSTWYGNVFIHPWAYYMMNEPCHEHQMQCGLQFIHSPLDGSTTQSWVVSLVHTNSSTYTFTSDNKDACRCFHDSELYCTASVLHARDTDVEMARWCCSFVGDCTLFPRECACALFFVNVRESISRGCESEGASSDQSGPLDISRLSEILFPASVFGLFPTCAVHIPHKVPGGRWTQHQHQQSHHRPRNLERKSFIS